MPRVSLLLALSALTLACHRDLGPGHARDDGDRLPLATVRLPNLTCSTLPVANGDCTRHADCGSGEVCGLRAPKRAADRGPLELACMAPIGDLDERARCDTGDDCATGLCALTGVCVAPCASDADCGLGQLCGALEIRAGKDGLAPLAACTRSSAFPEDVLLEASSTSVTVDVRNEVALAGGAGAQLYFAAAACDATLQVQGLSTRAEGTSLFEFDSLLTGEPSANPVVNLGALVPMLIPNNPDLQPEAGGYDVTLVADRSSDLALVHASRAGRGSTLDLNVFYAGGGDSVKVGGLHPGSKELARVYDSLADGYAAVGITLGHVREYDIVGALRDEVAVLETEVVRDETDAPVDFRIRGLEDLFRLSAGVDDGGLNLFLVADMGDVLGISGGIPGALGVHGTAASGVVVAVDVTGLGELPFVIQHELSHQMGLFHTTEIDGFSIEPLADTPVCDPDYDRNGDGVVSERECRAAGSDNLMFWSGGGSELSREQAAVLRASVVLR